MEKKVPEIRFKGFDGEWTSATLGDCFIERIERSADGELLSVTINSGIVLASETGRTDNSSNDKSNYKVVKKGDLAYNSMRMWQGACGHSEYDGIVSPAYTVVTPKDGCDVEYFHYSFKNNDTLYRFRVNSQGLTSDTWNLKYPLFSEIDCKYPSDEDEQKKIASLFKTLDRLIRSLELKLEKLKNIKQSLLNQMFTNGNRGGHEPLIRFKGYNDDWEVTVLGDISDKYFVSNQNIHHQNLLSLSYGKIKRKDIKSDKGLRPGSYDTYQLVKDGIIVMRFTDLQNDKKSLRVGLTKEEGIVSPAYTCISIKDNAIPEFMYFYLHYYDSVLKQFYKMGDGMRQTLSYKDIEPLQIFLPLKEEQEQITQAFNKVDYIISETDRKLVKIRSFKQSLLQKMFVN